jgi:3',5'-nucleoside bisphosphate phosphatase
LKIIVKLIAGLLLSIAASHSFSHGNANVSGPSDENRKIEFPDTGQYKTVILDPHTHSVFSDGHVWPRIRIGEALRDGLDAIAITEHLEWQPHLADIPHQDRNRSYQEAVAAAGDSELLVIPGSEITRSAPTGHINAIFITDANKLINVKEVEEPFNARNYYAQAGQWPAQEAVKAAADQGAFLFWNHAYWADDFPNGIPVVPDFHLNNIKKGLLHGIEIANGRSYSEETFQIALDHGLTLIGVSDVHNLIDWDYEVHNGGHRPVTLVFAKENSSEAVKDALLHQRTVVWFQNMLIGRKVHLEPLLAASLSLDSAFYPEGREVLSVTLSNHSDAVFQLRNISSLTFYTHTDLIEVPAHETIELYIKSATKIQHLELEFEVLNALIAPKEVATVKFNKIVNNVDDSDVSTQ